MSERQSKKRKRKQAPMHVGAANLCTLPPSPLHTLEYKTCIPKWLSNFTFTLPLQTTTRSREDNKRARDGKRERMEGGITLPAEPKAAAHNWEQLLLPNCGRQAGSKTNEKCLHPVHPACLCLLPKPLCRVHFECSCC